MSKKTRSLVTLWFGLEHLEESDADTSDGEIDDKDMGFSLVVTEKHERHPSEQEVECVS